VAEASDEILNIKILEHTETPGLGSRIENDDFRQQFAGKSTQDPIAIGSDIDNISGATISARAVAEAVREGFQDAYAAYRGGQ
jgi:electron transport complex protein RnfG